jgi:DNA-3-methyladenine glycosylase
VTRDPVGTAVDRADLAGDPLRVARWLLNKLLVHGERAGRIVEVEAYRGEDDPASHAYRGPTARNATMFGRPGLLYVYFTYGMHWCANVVCGSEGQARAVLVRALAPVAGVDEMRAARPAARSERDLTSGPAKLCQALGVTGELDGADLVTGDRGIAVADDGVPPPRRPGTGPRVGIRAAVDRPWRLWVPGDRHVSGAPAVRVTGTPSGAQGGRTGGSRRRV